MWITVNNLLIMTLHKIYILFYPQTNTTDDDEREKKIY